MQLIIHEQIDELLWIGCIEPSFSPQSPRFVLVGKRSGEM